VRVRYQCLTFAPTPQQVNDHLGQAAKTKVILTRGALLVKNEDRVSKKTLKRLSCRPFACHGRTAIVESNLLTENAQRDPF